MDAGGIHLVWAAIADMRPDLDEGRAGRLCLCILDSLTDGGGIIAVRQYLDVPAKGFKSFCHVFGERDIGVTLDGDMVVVIEEDEIAELKVTGDRTGFGTDAFHQVAVAADAVDTIVEQVEPGFVEPGGHVALGDGKAYRVGEA